VYCSPKWSFLRKRNEDDRINRAADCEDERRMVNNISGSIPMAGFDVGCIKPIDTARGVSV
jgi:hypothetical protein